MRIAAVLAGAAMAALAVTTAQSAVRIVSDPGGQIGPYLENLQALRSSGERTVVSANAAVFASVPSNFDPLW